MNQSEVMDHGTEARNEPRMELEVITPEQAKAYLDLNIVNRAVSKPTLERFKREMKANRWRLSGEAIKFNKEGKLIDGQHRLTACIATKIPLLTYVVRDLDNDVVNVIDTGRARRAHDVLALHGYPNAYLLASAARWLLVMRYGLQVTSDTSQVLKPSNEEILDVVNKHPKLVASCYLAARPKGAIPSLLSAIHYVGAEMLGKQEEADAFVRVFTKGEPYYPKDDPALKLREMVLADKLRGVEPTPKTHYVNMVYVWNAFSSRHSIPVFRPPQVTTIKGLKPSEI